MTGAVFIDTSAILAVRNAADEAHGRARSALAELAAERAPLLTTSYVLCEAYALLGRRLGRREVAAFRAGFAPLIEVRWVDAELHERGLDLLANSRKRSLSLVDACSFVAMRDARLDRAFAYDRHFEDEGFRCL